MTWTAATRGGHVRSSGMYASDVTDREWALIAPHLPAARPGGSGRPPSQTGRCSPLTGATAPSPFLPSPQHAESDTMGGLLTFAASASLTGPCLGSGHSAGGEIEHLFGSASARSEPKAAGLKSRPSLMQQTTRLGQSDRHAAAQPR
jgi:hypothetical protein